MPNKIIILLVLISNLFILNAFSNDQISFDVTEIEISDNGEKFVGKKRGKITSSDGVIIKANRFEYLKKLNILNASGDVEIIDTTNNNEIFTQTIIYEKTGYFFQSGNPQSLCNIILKVLNLDDTTLKSIGIEGRKNVVSKFNVEKMCFSTYSEYKKLIN